jgi:Protein of unknown function (DUF2798)
MDARTRLIRALCMSGAMVFMVTLVVTYLNLGLHAGFVAHWLAAFAIAWPIAAATSWTIMPTVNALTDRIVARLDRRR